MLIVLLIPPLIHGWTAAITPLPIGPGTGSFLVFAMVSMLGYDFLNASAKAKIANLVTRLPQMTKSATIIYRVYPESAAPPARQRRCRRCGAPRWTRAHRS